MENKKERVLIVGAHYDDTAWCWAGLVALLTKKGVQVDEAVFTDSDYAGIGLQRKEEQLRMMGILGMSILYAVGEQEKFKDGHLKEISTGIIAQSLIRILANAKNNNNPYTIIVGFGQKDGGTGHPDHKALARAVKQVFYSKEKYEITELWQYGMSPKERELWPKDYFVPIPKINLKGYTPINIGDVFNEKLAAIAAHQTQFEIPGGGGRAHIERLKLLPKHEYFKIYRR